MVSFLVLAFLLNVIKSHNHSIIFLVDGSTNIGKEECNKRQEGIGEYFQTFYDLHANNVLSYMTFDPFGQVKKIIDFGDESHIPFNNLVQKIKLLNCDENNDNSDYKKNFNLVNSALQSALSTFNVNDIRTPRILLFNHFFSAFSINATADCDDKLSNINYLLQNKYFNKLVISIVNLDLIVNLNNFLNDGDYNINDYILDYYSQCFAKINEHSLIKQVVTLKDVQRDTFAENNENIIYSICAEPTPSPTPEPNPTPEPTPEPTPQPTRAPQTASPTTASPTTASPTTASPTTASPTTARPTTASPTTFPPIATRDSSDSDSVISGSGTDSESGESSFDAVAALFVDTNNFDKSNDIHSRSIVLNSSIYLNALVMLVLVLCILTWCCLYYVYNRKSTNLHF